MPPDRAVETADPHNFPDMGGNQRDVRTVLEDPQILESVFGGNDAEARRTGVAIAPTLREVERLLGEGRVVTKATMAEAARRDIRMRDQIREEATTAFSEEIGIIRQDASPSPKPFLYNRNEGNSKIPVGETPKQAEARIALLRREHSKLQAERKGSASYEEEVVLAEIKRYIAEACKRNGLMDDSRCARDLLGIANGEALQILKDLNASNKGVPENLRSRRYYSVIAEAAVHANLPILHREAYLMNNAVELAKGQLEVEVRGSLLRRNIPEETISGALSLLKTVISDPVSSRDKVTRLDPAKMYEPASLEPSPTSQRLMKLFNELGISGLELRGVEVFFGGRKIGGVGGSTYFDVLRKVANQLRGSVQGR